MVTTLAVSTLGGYAFARFTFPGRDALFLLTLAILMVPYATLLIPLYVLLNSFGMQNSLIGLSLVLAVFQLPFATYMMRISFEAVPRELEESALVDGCGTFSVLWRIRDGEFVRDVLDGPGRHLPILRWRPVEVRDGASCCLVHPCVQLIALSQRRQRTMHLEEHPLHDVVDIRLLPHTSCDEPANARVQFRPHRLSAQRHTWHSRSPWLLMCG